jgi:hypothetical protein
MKRLIIPMLCAVAATVLSCGNLVGGGDDFPNSKVTGAFVNTNLTSAARTKVCLVPNGYDPAGDQPLVSSNIDTTDTAGCYSFVVAGSGRYNITAKQLDSGTMAFIGNICVSGGADVNVPVTALKQPGAVSVTLPPAVDTVNGYLYVPGTLLSFAIPAAGGSIILDSLPSGTLPGIYYAVRNSAGSTMVRYGIDVVPGDTVIDPGWAFSREVGLNTTSSGAQVSGDVVNFPVYIRLTGSDFDFSQAESGGADLFFAKSDDTPLPFEIEQWDSAGSRSVVWVLVDTVYGDNSSQHFMMYWGNAGAGAGSDPSAVFDTANGFQGVWHLADAGNSAAKDATANRYDGTPSGMTAASAVDGMVGGAKEFDGTSSHFVMAGTAGSTLNFPENGSYTVSAWVYADTLDGDYHTIASKGDKQYNLETMAYSNNWEFAECKTTGGWEVTNSPSAAKGWTHIAGVRNGLRQYLFVNGVCADSSISLYYQDTVWCVRNTGSDFTVGKKPEESDFFYNGKIDEIRASSVARSPDWMRLSYMNQKAEDALVVLK